MGDGQLSIVDDKLEPELVKSADRLVELIREAKDMKDRKQVRERDFMGLMRKAKKQKIRHAGMLLEVKHINETEKVVAKEYDPTKKPKGKGKRGSKK